MSTEKDIEIYKVHGEISSLFERMKDRVFHLRTLGMDTIPLLVALNIIAEHLTKMARSESERHKRRIEVEELLSELRKGDGEQKS